MDTELWKAVNRRLVKSDIAGAVDYLEERLAREEDDRFKGLLGKRFSNSPKSILSAINKFINACSKKFSIKAVYLEMNGFDINPDRWYFTSFGYTEYGADPEDLEWLCDWKEPYGPHVTLNGLEPVQADFEWYHSNEIWKDKKYKRTYDLAVLLVMCKYVSLIEAALAAGPRSKPVPVLATAHEFDILGRFEP